MAAFLEKSTGSEGFHQVIYFLSQSHISYALTKKPEIYISFIKQFWRTAEASTNDDEEVSITANIDGQSKTITEASLRRHLKLEDHDGITSIPNSEIFEQLTLMGYQKNSDNNMRRLTKGYTRVEIRLFPTMLTSPPLEPLPTPSSSPSRITSSPSQSSKPSTAPTFEPQPSPDAAYHVPTPNESLFHVVHSHGSDEGSLKLNELTNLVTKLSERIGVLEDDLKKIKQTYSSTFTKLILRVKKLEYQVKTGKARQIDKDPNTYFAQDDEVVHDQDTTEEGQQEDSTVGIIVSTAPISFNTARESHSTDGRVYGRRNLDIEKEKKKPAEFQQIEKEQVEKDTTGKRKKSLPRKRTRSTTKIQKVELDDEKEDLKGYLDIVPREDVAEDVESLSTKYLIVDWKTYTLSKNFMYYKIIRGDGSSKNYKILSEMLYDFDRQDVVELFRLVKERYNSSKLEGYDLMLWGDLHTLFEPDEESEIWMNQNEYNLISWSLCDLCRVHILLMQNGIAIHILTEKKYPLSQEMISKMLKVEECLKESSSEDKKI
ncbi:hypothetical protein Tco_0184615 [Tanacetum coccineum]